MEKYYINTIWARGWHQKYHPTAQGLRAKPEARGLRDGIFDATQGPIWYFYYLIVYFMKNICRNSFDIKWHQKMVLKILAFKISQKIRQSDAQLSKNSVFTKKFVKITHREVKESVFTKKFVKTT